MIAVWEKMSTNEIKYYVPKYDQIHFDFEHFNDNTWQLNKDYKQLLILKCQENELKSIENLNFISCNCCPSFYKALECLKVREKVF